MIFGLISPLLLLVRPVHLQHFDQTKSLMNSLTNHFYYEHTCSILVNRFLMPLLGIDNSPLVTVAEI